MLSKREQWLPKIYSTGALDINHLEEFSRELIVNHLKDLRVKAQEILRPKFFQLLQVNKKEDISKITKPPGVTSDDLQEWKIISNLLITKSNGDWRKRVDKKIGFPAELKKEKALFLKILEGLDSELEFKKMLINLDNLPSPNFQESTKKSISDIAQVLKLSVAKLKIIFDQEVIQDFPEVNFQAINALDGRGEISDIALLLDYQIKHILIDEFQDTSYSQLNLIERLVQGWQQDEGKTIFCVGDPMQSIYKFRESQVGIFIDAASNGIGNLRRPRGMVHLVLPPAARRQAGSDCRRPECGDRHRARPREAWREAPPGLVPQAAAVSPRRPGVVRLLRPGRVRGRAVQVP